MDLKVGNISFGNNTPEYNHARRSAESLRLIGRLKIEIHDALTGNVIKTYESENLVTTAGKNLVRDLLAGDAVNALTHFALGTGTTAPVVGDTTLETEVFRDTITQFVDATAELQVKYFLASVSANGNTLAESGLLNAAASGTLFARVLISPVIVKTSAIAATFTWTITIA